MRINLLSNVDELVFVFIWNVYQQDKLIMIFLSCHSPIKSIAGETSWIASTSDTMKLVATMCRHSGKFKSL